jgi:uncharacterized caspase-like protein
MTMTKLTLWLSAAALFAANVAQAGDRHALVIGNQKYAHGALSNPDKDARDMAQHLRALGFEVDLVLDASLREMSERAGAYVAKLHGGDTSFVFYSGHGVQVKGENFLIPVDFEATKESDVPFTAYPADRLIDGLNEQSLELSVIVFDACRDNPFKVSRSGNRGLTIMAAGSGTLIAFATGPGQTAADGTPGGNGVFTGALLKYIDQPGLDVDTLFKRVREDVSAATARAQVPWSSSNVVGTFYLKPLAAVSTGDEQARLDEANAKLAREKAELEAEKAELEATQLEAEKAKVAREKAELAAKLAQQKAASVVAAASGNGDTFLAVGHEWQTKPAENSMNWEAAKSYCAGQGSGWRLPDKDELKALYDAKQSSPEIAVKPGMSWWYWSSTPGGNGDAWYVAFPNGLVLTDNVFNSSDVRCVR